MANESSLDLLNRAFTASYLKYCSSLLPELSIVTFNTGSSLSSDLEKLRQQRSKDNDDSNKNNKEVLPALVISRARRISDDVLSKKTYNTKYKAYLDDRTGSVDYKLVELEYEARFYSTTNRQAERFVEYLTIFRRAQSKFQYNIDWLQNLTVDASYTQSTPSIDYVSDSYKEGFVYIVKQQCSLYGVLITPITDTKIIHVASCDIIDWDTDEILETIKVHSR